MSETFVPLISSGVSGPLGILHLPRLWQKASLEARGRIAPGYPGCGKGYDQMVLNGLGLDREKTLAFIRDERPTYPQFESWIRRQPNVKLDKPSIEALNAGIKGYIHTDDVRKEIFANSGLTDETCSFRDAINLNNLDDWHAFHQAALK